MDTTPLMREYRQIMTRIATGCGVWTGPRCRNCSSGEKACVTCPCCVCDKPTCEGCGERKAGVKWRG